MLSLAVYVTELPVYQQMLSGRKKIIYTSISGEKRVSCAYHYGSTTVVTGSGKTASGKTYRFPSSAQA